MSLFAELGLYLLEIQRLDQGEELVDCKLEVVIDKSVGKKDWVVCQFDLLDGVCNAHFELRLGFNSVANTFA